MITRNHLMLLCLLSVRVMARDDGNMDFELGREMMFDHHGNSSHTLFMADRLEWPSSEDMDTTWDIQGWHGKDLNRIWLKTEGQTSDASSQGKLQLLYGRAISPFFDLQIGTAHAWSGDGPERHAMVVGLQGLAPYWFETDVSLTLNNHGQLAAHSELELDLYLGQSLILQPRLEALYAFSEDIQAGSGSGLNSLGAGLRLRYEWRRSFAPYIGVQWRGHYSATADILRTEGQRTEEFTAVAGFRFWY